MRYYYELWSSISTFIFIQKYHRIVDVNEDFDGSGRDANCSPDISSDGFKNVNSEDGLVTKANKSVEELKHLDMDVFVMKGTSVEKGNADIHGRITN